MTKLPPALQRPRAVVGAAFFVVLLCSCAGTGHPPGSAGVSAPDGKAKPEQTWSPIPGPPGSRALNITKIVVPSEKTKPTAIYQRSGPPVDASIPDFEIPKSRAGTQRRNARWAPGPVDIEKSAALDPQPLFWTNVDSPFLSADFDDNGTENAGFRFIPPDPHAAAGPNHVVNVVNTMITVHLKDGTFVWRDSLADFFSSLSPLTFTFDPKVLYDQYAGRWVVITMEQDTGPNSSRMFVAVSDDDDPTTGTWFFSEFDTVVDVDGTDHWADYPGFAVDEEAVYITTNLFSFSGGVYGGSRVWILEKGIGAGGFYDSGGTLVVGEFDPYAAPPNLATTTQPSHMFGTAPAGLGVFLVSFSGINDGFNEFIQVVTLDDPLGTPVFTQTTLSLGNIDGLSGALPDMPQLGTNTLIESNDRRALDAVWRNDALWLTTTIDPDSGVDSGQATALWVKIDTSNLASLGLADSGQIGGEDIAAGTYTTFPSIAVNPNEDVVVGFSASAPTIFAGAYFVDRDVSNPAGFMGPAVTVQAGVAKYKRTFGGSRNRWGDYSGTAVDPVDGCFWVYNEWADTEGTRIRGELGRWGTAYARTCNPSLCRGTYHIAANEWTKFALPCTGPNNTVMDIFGSKGPADPYYLNPADYDVTWGVFGRNSVTQTYFLLDLADSMTEGNGYWVISPTATQANLVGSPAATDDIVLVGVPAGRDNYVGHNRNNSVPWNAVQVVDGVDVFSHPGFGGFMSPIMNKWNGSAYQVFDGDDGGGSPGTLDPFDAVWVQAFANVELRIPGGAAAAAAASSVQVTSAVKSGSSTEAQGPGKSKKPKDRSWYIRLIASAGEMEDPGNVLGQLDTAMEGNDAHDLEEPSPFGGKYLSILFTNPLFAPVNWGFTTDFRALTKRPRGVWPFVVKAYAGIHEVTIHWEGEDYVLEHAWLVDEQTGEVIEVRTGEDYTFEIEGGEHHFRFELDDGKKR